MQFISCVGLFSAASAFEEVKATVLVGADDAAESFGLLQNLPRNNLMVQEEEVGTPDYSEPIVNEDGCRMKIDGPCDLYQSMSNSDWFDDSTHGGPPASTNEVCMYRQGSWKNDCGDKAKISMSFMKRRLVKFVNLCLHAHGDSPATFSLPRGMDVSEVIFERKSGGLTCRGGSHRSNFGCDHDSLGLVITEKDKKEVLMPLATQKVAGFERMSHNHAHWYKLQGVGETSLQMKWKFGMQPVLGAGKYELWYNEDLTNGTESDNAGKACYKVKIFGTTTTTTINPHANYARRTVRDVCIHARGDKPATFRLPGDMMVGELIFTHKSGGLTCRHGSHRSNFGCDHDSLGLVITEKDKKEVLMPLATQKVEGFERMSHNHAHWYKLQGVGETSFQMKWKFGMQPVLGDGEYELWYNEDLTNGTVGDNAGTACYDVEILGSPKTVRDVCIHARGDKPATFSLPGDMSVSEVIFTHKSGGLTCRRGSHRSNFGCDHDSLGLVITEKDKKEVLMPLATQKVEGFERMSHKHAHWYKLQGVGEASLQMKWKFGMQPVLGDGEYKLWYNEDLTKGTVGDNAGTACYDIEVLGSPPPAGCTDFQNVGEDCTNKDLESWDGTRFQKIGQGHQWATTSSCVAYVSTGGGTCKKFCSTNGKSCVRAMDDAHHQTAEIPTLCTLLPSLHHRQSQAENGCNQKWATQICACA